MEPLGGRDFLYLETISNISWKTVIPSLKLPSFPSNGRRIVYLHCCDNYRADTVLHLFIESVRQLGLPSRVRGDRGGENIGVAGACFNGTGRWKLRSWVQCSQSAY